MEPAFKIISALGGTTRVSILLGCHRSYVWKWTRPREKGGTGGVIPLDYIRPLLEEGRRLGLDLAAEDFLPAAPADQLQGGCEP